MMAWTWIVLALLVVWSYALLCIGFKVGLSWGIDEMKRRLDESGAIIFRRNRD